MLKNIVNDYAENIIENIVMKTMFYSIAGGYPKQALPPKTQIPTLVGSNIEAASTVAEVLHRFAKPRKSYGMYRFESEA